MATEQPIVVLQSSDDANRKALAAEMAKLRENPPSETVEGGRYLNAAGDVVNAAGKVLEAASDEDSSGDAETSHTAAKSAKKR